MKYFCNEIEDQKVYPILIKNYGKSYLTLYYYTAYSDSVLHSDEKRILYLQSPEQMNAFCKKHELKMDEEIAEYDFDAPIENPVDYTRVLNNWNLLNTIAGAFGMYFEGDSKKYTPLYRLLFRLNTPIEPIPPVYRLHEKDYQAILKVFRKKDRFLKLFELYSQE